jgi:hypothetical protein
MADEQQVLNDAKKLPLGEQLAHCSWKVRAQALTTIQERVGRAFSCEDEIFAEAGGQASWGPRGEAAAALLGAAAPPRFGPPAAPLCCRPPSLACSPAALQGGGRHQCQRDGQGGGDAGGIPRKGR